MAFAVRSVGPEYTSSDTAEAFQRIEEAVRQYSLHSRESILLARNPFVIEADHLAIVWLRGGALIEFFDKGGIIRGNQNEEWTFSSGGGAETKFENPIRALKNGQRTLVSFLKKHVGEPVAAAPGGPGEVFNLDAFANCVKGIAVFTKPVSELTIEDDERMNDFVAMSLEHATSRTMFHLPNILRVINAESVCFSPSEILLLSSALESEAEKNLASREEARAREQQGLTIRRQLRRMSSGTRMLLGAALTALLVLVIYFVVRPASHSDTAGNQPETGPEQHEARPIAYYSVLITLPSDIQLYISPQQYKSRSELDQALAHGVGHRFLPSRTQEITLDSTLFAKGVFGYFKVENAWRKGKLLQTFKAQDTIKIDNFLPPLP